jgi:N-acetylmuramoyl-L-alanine amidase
MVNVLSNELFKLFIDPGHGGSDPGAMGNGLQEKNLTLAISLEIRRILANEYEGVAVKLSRSRDETLSLDQRTGMANAWDADFLLSVHVNAFNGSAQGYEDFIYAGLSDSSRTAQLREIIHAEIIKAVDDTDRGMKKANFHMLRESAMPAMLTENLFIDNEGDARKLKSKAFIDRVARGHVNGIAKAFNLKKKPKPKDYIHRLIVDGKQVIALKNDDSLLNEVEKYLNEAKKIEIERVR